MSQVYFFRGNEYDCYDTKNDALDIADPSYPRPIDGNWIRLPTTGIDATLNWGNRQTYFFSGSDYYRFDAKTDQVDPDPVHPDLPYKRPITEGWKGLTLDHVDACIKWDTKTAYF